MSRKKIIILLILVNTTLTTTHAQYLDSYGNIPMPAFKFAWAATFEVMFTSEKSLQQLRVLSLKNGKREGRSEPHSVFKHYFKINNINWLKNYTKLKYLDLSGRLDASVDLSALSYLKELEYLYLNNNNLTDNQLKQIGQLPNLKCLGLNGNQIKNGIFIHNINPSLEKLYASNNQFTSFPVFNQLKVLRIDKSSCSLKGKLFPKLTKFYCIECQQFNSIQDLPKMPKLTALYLHDNSSLSSLLGLNKYQMLTELYISGSNISSLSGLTTPLNLTTLFCENSGLITLDGIEKLSHLNTLNISNNKLKSLKGLNHQDLEILTCDMNQLTGIEEVSHSPKLSKLYVQNNNLKSLKGIENLKLGILNIENNSDIQSIEPIEKSFEQKTLTYLYLSGSTKNIPSLYPWMWNNQKVKVCIDNDFKFRFSEELKDKIYTYQFSPCENTVQDIISSR